MPQHGPLFTPLLHAEKGAFTIFGLWDIKVAVSGASILRARQVLLRDVGLWAKALGQFVWDRWCPEHLLQVAATSESVDQGSGVWLGFRSQDEKDFPETL